MNAKRALLSAAVLCASAAVWSVFGPVSAQERDKREAPAAARWEYQVITMTPNDGGHGLKELQKLGDEGFKLVSTTSTPTSAGGAAGTYPTTVFVMERANREPRAR